MSPETGSATPASGARHPRARARDAWLALLFFTLVTAAVFRPTLHELAHTAPVDRGQRADGLLLMWATSHVSQTLFEDPLHLFEGGIFHPARHALAYGDHMIGQALLGLPVWLATGNPLLEYNLLHLASFVLLGTAVFAYARGLLTSPVAAAAAGAAAAFTPLRLQAPLWLQLLVTPFMPLTLLFWSRFAERLRARDWALFVLCWTAHSLMGMYLALLFAITMGVVSLTALAASPNRRRGRLWAGTLSAPPAVLVLLSPTLLPYVHLREVLDRTRGGLDTPLGGVFLPGSDTLTARLSGLDDPHQFGPGLVVWALAALGLLVVWRRAGSRRDPWRRFRWTAHAVGLGVSTGLCLLPISAYQALPGLDALRVTNRAFLIALVFLALFAGAAVDWLAARTPSRRAGAVAATALLALVLADMGPVSWTRDPLPVGAEIPAPYRWLREAEGEGAVFDRALLGRHTQALSMYYAIFHGRPIVGGYSGSVPPGSVYAMFAGGRFPEDPAVDVLSGLGVRYVVWNFYDPRAIPGFASRAVRPGVEVAARFEDAVIFRISARGARDAAADTASALPRADWRLAASDAPGTLDALRDGDRSSAWRAERRGEDGDPMWIRVDLGRPLTLVGVRCAPAAVDAHALYRARVEISRDGRRFEPVASAFRPASLETLFERPRELDHYELAFAPRRARYLRLENPASTFLTREWEIAELDVLADCAREPGIECPAPAEPGARKLDTPKRLPHRPPRPARSDHPASPISATPPAADTATPIANERGR